MFDALKELVESFEVPMKSARAARENRKILQAVRVEALRLRQEISEKMKAKDYDKK